MKISESPKNKIDIFKIKSSFYINISLKNMLQKKMENFLFDYLKENIQYISLIILNIL